MFHDIILSGLIMKPLKRNKTYDTE